MDPALLNVHAAIPSCPPRKRVPRRPTLHLFANPSLHNGKCRRRYGRTLQVARVVLIIAPIFAVFEVTVYLYLTDLYVYPVLIVCNHIIFVWFMCAAILDAVVEPALWLSQDVRRAAQHAISAIVVLASIWITMAVGFVVFFDLVSGYFGRQNGWVGGRAAANMASGTFLGLPMTGLREAAYSFMPQDPLNIRWFPGAMPFSAPSPPA